MSKEENGTIEDVDLRPLVGLLAGVPERIIEGLTVEAIKKHRDLVEKAEILFQNLPTNAQGGIDGNDATQIDYFAAAIEMHAQMSALTTLLKILGRTPKV
ncbi:transcriptional repressor TraM [Rhizobium pusense]|uniref:transcriptional repressor TraM n=2 Tax=Agrobacterium pusense TaxID=648995 RepID=UPI00244C7537|nr:transcriptional repressor TraM [Agrobacterium pusense]MDH1098564.1 transcriptional repressor TraM [Agrobacterium pusense]MDH1115274.1 transcriptional repressor TraM [Agrobacterium pusense]MDH2197085.1 transcriptional repressor TraM [Agrobacterium pusense]